MKSGKTGSGKRGFGRVLLILLVLVLAGAYYYVTLPAINIHSQGFWGFIILFLY